MSGRGPDWPASPFWDFSLLLYARPGVEAACLTLQDDHGLDVNLVLLAGWAAHTRRRLTPPLAQRLRALGLAYQADVMQPLRQARRGLKAYEAVLALAPLASACRQSLLGCELDLERLEQVQLETLLDDGASDAASPVEPSFIANLGALYPDRQLPASVLAALATAMAGLPAAPPPDRTSP